MVPVVGLEPTRGISPTDFESVTSTNSITPANLFLLYKLSCKNSRGIFQDYPESHIPSTAALPLSDYLAYYRRKSCIFALNILSIFDALLKCKAQSWELYPNLSRAVFLLFNRFPAFPCSLLQIPSASADIYINFFVKGFYEELFTLSTWFSTLPFP